MPSGKGMRSFKRLIFLALAVSLVCFTYGILFSLSNLPVYKMSEKWVGGHQEKFIDERCALLFFGLPKHFKDISLPSIRKYIIRANPSCDVYAHTYNVGSISNERNGEVSSPIHPKDIYSLTKEHAMDSEEDFLSSHNLTYYRSLFPYEEPWIFPTSMDNMIKQWHSIDQVWKMMEDSEIEYHQVGLFRLDVLYVHDISISAGEGEAVVPDFLPSGGMNDRMFFGRRDYAEVWATKRFGLVQNYIDRYEDRGLHSEKFMEFLMQKIPVEEKPICFHRVRGTGKIKKDCSLGFFNDLKTMIFGYDVHFKEE